MPEAQPLRPGDPGRLGAYELEGRLGEGGQGAVFLGRAPSGEPVAVKLLHAVDDAAARARFVRELAVAKQVATFCTAQVLDADVAGDRPYIVSEYVDGPTLQQSVMTAGPRGKGALERLAIGTATALTAIHQAGVVHRDFKPANVLLGSDGPRVIDFGIARALDVTATISQLIGTPSYMAPEQLTSGTAVGPATDVFAWANTIVFAATGRPAFGQDSVPAVMHRIIHDEPDLTALPDSLRGMVYAALAKDPGRRPAAQLLLWWLVGSEGPAAPGTPDPVYTAARFAAAVPGNPGAVVAPSDPAGLVPGFEPPPHAGTAPLPVVPARPAAGDNRALFAIGAVVLAGLVAGLAFFLGPRLLDREGTANPASGTRPPTVAEAGRGVPAAFDGTWRGTAQNQDGVTFPAEVTFQAGRDSARLTYSGEANCATTLTLTGRTADRIELNLPAAPSCTPGTVIVRTRPDGRLDYAFASGTGHYTIQATLSRA
jgi:hypothetical protein